MGGHHRSTGCCLWDAPAQPCREVGAGPAQALPGCSRGLWMLQGLPGVWVWGSLRGFCCCEDPGGSKGSGLLLRTHMSWRGVPRNLGCPQEPGCPQEFGCLRNLGCPQEPTVFPGIWGVPRSPWCSQEFGVSAGAWGAPRGAQRALGCSKRSRTSHRAQGLSTPGCSEPPAHCKAPGCSEDSKRHQSPPKAPKASGCSMIPLECSKAPGVLGRVPGCSKVPGYSKSPGMLHGLQGAQGPGML